MAPQAAAEIHDDVADSIEVEIVERRDIPGAWSVEAIDHASEGEIYLAVFSGPSARDRAVEYARMKYQR